MLTNDDILILGHGDLIERYFDDPPHLIELEHFYSDRLKKTEEYKIVLYQDSRTPDVKVLKSLYRFI